MATALALSHGGPAVNTKKSDVGVDLDRFKGTSLIASTRGKPRQSKEPAKCQTQPVKPEKQTVIKPAPDINVTGATIISPTTTSLPNNELSKWAGMPLVSVTASIWAAKNAAKKQKNMPATAQVTAKGGAPPIKPVYPHAAVTEIPGLISGQRHDYHELNHPPPSPFLAPPPPVSPAPFGIHRYIQPPAVRNISHQQQYQVHHPHHPLVYTRSVEVVTSATGNLVPHHQPLRVCHSSSEAFYMNFDHSSGSDEGSGVGSDGGLPRIIKPRKRRKKDKRLGDSINTVEMDYNDNMWHDGSHDQFRNGETCANPWSGVNYGPCWSGVYLSPPMTPPSANNRERRFSFSSSISSSEEDVIASLMTLSRISTPPPTSSSSSSALSWTLPVTPPFEGIDTMYSRRDEWQNGPKTVDWHGPVSEAFHQDFFEDNMKQPVNVESLLQVSSEIIASPYGHRDIEIKFFSNKQCL